MGTCLPVPTAYLLRVDFSGLGAEGGFICVKTNKNRVLPLKFSWLAKRNSGWVWALSCLLCRLPFSRAQPTEGQEVAWGSLEAVVVTVIIFIWNGKWFRSLCFMHWGPRDLQQFAGSSWVLAELWLEASCLHFGVPTSPDQESHTLWASTKKLFLEDWSEDTSHAYSDEGCPPRAIHMTAVRGQSIL